jgi:two-component sensor histidine kinase
VKYAAGKISVRIETASAVHLLSVIDDGPGLPEGFDPAASKGLGMKIVRSLVRQIGGTMQFAPGEGGRGTCFSVSFPPQS